MQHKPVKYFVKESCAINGVSRANKAFRKQRVLCEQDDEVIAIEFMIDPDEAFLEVGEYRLAPDAIYVGEVERADKSTGKVYTSKGLKVAPRFVKVPTLQQPAKA